jgi:hypothetical protein
MKETVMTLLGPDGAIPQLYDHTLDGADPDVPESLAGSFADAVANGSVYCPYCNAQLRAFQQTKDKLIVNDCSRLFQRRDWPTRVPRGPRQSRERTATPRYRT